LTYTDLNETDNFLTYPTNRVVAIVDTPDELRSAIAQLNQTGFEEDKIDVLCGQKGADRLDVTGEHHGFLARLYRFIEKFGDMESENLREYEHELRGGHFLLAVEVPDDERRAQVVQILESHGGHRINFYGRWQVEGLVS
jgi:hypothetical protein